VTTIRPNSFPQTPPQAGLSQAGPAQDAAKLAAQKAFFAIVSGQAQPAAAATVGQPTVATPVVRSVAPSAETPQKIPRPGSLFDIRV
jgi:hypothetical protein